jgi:hypothetical protein
VKKGKAQTRWTKANGNQQHHRHPAQPARFDKEFFARTHRITIDAFGRDLGSTTALNRLVDAHHNGGVIGHKDLYQYVQEQAGEQSRRPLRSVEHPVVILKLSLLLQAYHAQNRCHCPFSRSQDCSDHEPLDPLPDLLRT